MRRHLTREPSPYARPGGLIYLAGDIAWGHDAVRDDLIEIVEEGGSSKFCIFVQYDGPEGGERYVVPPTPSKRLSPTQRFHRLDSGQPGTLLDFLRWSLALCRAERLALVIGSPLAVSPAEAERDPGVPETPDGEAFQSASRRIPGKRRPGAAGSHGGATR
jgi:hypothetical protein